MASTSSSQLAPDTSNVTNSQQQPAQIHELSAESVARLVEIANSINARNSMNDVTYQKTACRVLLTRLLESEHSKQEELKKLLTIHHNQLPNPEIFRPIIRLTAAGEPCFEFYHISENNTHSLTEMLPGVDRETLHTCSEIYSVIYALHGQKQKEQQQQQSAEHRENNNNIEQPGQRWRQDWQRRRSMMNVETKPTQEVVMVAPLMEYSSPGPTIAVQASSSTSVTNNNNKTKNKGSPRKLVSPVDTFDAAPFACIHPDCSVPGYFAKTKRSVLRHVGRVHLKNNSDEDEDDPQKYVECRLKRKRQE